MIDLESSLYSCWVRVRGLKKRLDEIAQIIESVDDRCISVDGPVTPTLQEMTQEEIRKIYKLAKGRKKK